MNDLYIFPNNFTAESILNLVVFLGIIDALLYIDFTLRLEMSIFYHTVLMQEFCKDTLVPMKISIFIYLEVPFFIFPAK